MGQLKQELQKLRAAQQESFLPVPARSSKNLPETHELAGQKPSPTQGAQEAERTPPASFLETTTPESAKVSSEDKRPRLAVWHPHPDDGAGREKASEGQTRTGSDAPVKVFRKHYDKYLENYQGYVELAERLYQMRDNGEMPPGLEEREWENRLHRVNDGIERTTARLDILEEHNPELATDDRVSHRASLARRHSLLGA